jgi:hypothetical protein
MSDIQYLMTASPAKLNIIILDACRDDEGLRSSRHSIFSKGLAPMSPKGNGTLICYSTEAGKTSSDGEKNSHSEYTEALLEFIGIPNLPILSILERVHDEVFNLKNLDQNPCIYSSVGSEYNFCLSVADDGIHKSAVKAQAALVDSFRNTQVKVSTHDRDALLAQIILKFDSTMTHVTQTIVDSIKEIGGIGTGYGPDYDKCTYNRTYGLKSNYSNYQSIIVTYDLHLDGATLYISMKSNNSLIFGPPAPDLLKAFETAHNLLSTKNFEYSVYAVNWTEFADVVKTYYYARAPIFKR